MFGEKKKDLLTKGQLVSEVIKYCESANRDVDTATIMEKFIIKDHEYTVSVSCTVKKVQS